MENREIQIKNYRLLTLKSYYDISFGLPGNANCSCLIKDFGDPFFFFLAEDLENENIVYIIRNPHKGAFGRVRINYIKAIMLSENYYFVKNTIIKIVTRGPEKDFCEFAGFFSRWCLL